MKFFCNNNGLRRSCVDRSLPDLIGQYTSGVFRDGQFAFQRWHRALVAIWALTDPTGNPNRLKRGGVADVHIVGIDHAIGMFDFTSQGDGITPDGRAIVTARF